MKSWLSIFVLFCAFYPSLRAGEVASQPEDRLAATLEGHDFEYTVKDLHRDIVHRVATRSVHVDKNAIALSQSEGNVFFQQSQVHFKDLLPKVVLTEVYIPGTQTSTGLVRIRVDSKSPTSKCVKNSYLLPQRGWFYDDVSWFEFKVGSLAVAEKIKADLLLLIQAAQLANTTK